jgi:hypothetical protein
MSMLFRSASFQQLQVLSSLASALGKNDPVALD